MKRFDDLVADCLPHIEEAFPWDIDEKLQSETGMLILDIREKNEFDAMHIKDSLHVPRGVLESACEYDYEETVKELVESRDKNICIVCRSGKRSALAAYTLQEMGYRKVSSMKTGLRGWNDYELVLVDSNSKAVNLDAADSYFTSKLRDDQLSPG